VRGGCVDLRRLLRQWRCVSPPRAHTAPGVSPGALPPRPSPPHLPKVFGGRLPKDLPLVWNPRLLTSAGRVVDDGSRNAEKAARGERIPCRLELSPKVGKGV
jgi:hypothetical protein